MTEQEKRELEALRAKAKDGKATEDEKARMEALEAAVGDDEQAFSREYVEALRKENGKYRTRAKEAEERLAALDGVDPEEYRKLKDEAAKAEKAKLEEKGEWEKLRQQLVDAHAHEVGKHEKKAADLKAQLDSLNAELNTTILGHEIAVQASVAKAINPSLVELVVKGMAKVEANEQGKRIIKVLDASGNERMDLKTGKPFRVAQLLEELKTSEQYAHLFAGGTAGANSGTVRVGDSIVKNPWKAESLNLTLQGKILRENPALAERLKQEAGVRTGNFNYQT